MTGTVLFRAVRSRRKFMKNPEVRKKISQVLVKEVKPHLIGEFKGVVSDWKNKPQFFGRKTVKVDEISLFIHPGGKNKQIYVWVSGGTEGPYKIPKAGPGFLAFTLGYSARTRPRGQAHVGSGTASGPFVAGIMQVTHPGIEAREFEAVITEDNKAWFSRTMENAWRRIIRSL